MDRFEGATTVRLKGAHGKYLWAEHDHYGVSQENEDKNEQALWRVERPHTGSKPKTVRFRSCFDTYLTASENHYHGIAFLSFPGKRVTQMRPENVESTTTFDWEPVMDRGVLKLKSCYGTYLRANAKTPPWNNSVSHGIPQHQNHVEWLGWEVQKVRGPHVVPLELVIGPIELSKNEQRPPLDERSKYPGEITARSRADESERRPTQGRRANNPDVVTTTRRGDESERQSVPYSSRNPGATAAGRAEESERHVVQDRSRNPGAAATRRTDESARHPVQERYRDPGASANRRADELEQRPMPGRRKAPDAATARRASERASEGERHSVQERFRNLDVNTPRSGEEESDRHPAEERARRTDRSEQHQVQERARNPGVRPARRG